MWETRFTHPLLESLSVEEVLTIPGQKEKVVWTSGDATLDKVAGIDWSAMKAFACDVGPLKATMEQFVKEASGTVEDPDESEGSGFIISITEMLAVVTLASLRARDWGGKLVLYAGDNQNVIQWLSKRQAKHPVATYLLQILAALEASWRFRLHGAFVRTYHNTTADALTRGRGYRGPEGEGSDGVERRRGVLGSPARSGMAKESSDLGWPRRCRRSAGVEVG